ncbi:hypothetical protein [Clostridium algidicarnis]|uniref:hypothetical protein n=1 Tax=Clostridium algidicarnis TaxID=37659 RepID=UPI001C0B5A8F|nr:hypothetical protein [Clostridium algidicarnis]MBU3194633.1 hypothetical protein [Clostridium algidicarnis]MBU3207938.1 hypothetical protein [Clostridium algidicarnis]
MKRSLNLEKLKDRKIVTISSNQALKDIVPINWSKKVLNGRKQVEVCSTNKSNKIVNVEVTKLEDKCSKTTVDINKDPFLLTVEDLKRKSVSYNISSLSVSHVNEWQKYKNRYSRILMKAKHV